MQGEIKTTPVIFISRPTSELPTVGDGLKEKKACQFLFVVRGTSTSFEWRQDLEFGLTRLIDNLETFTGFSRLIKSVQGSLQRYLDKIFESECDITQSQIHVTGHSLGGGVAAVLSTWLAYHYDNAIGLVNFVGFAAPNTLGIAAYNFFSKKVNARVLRFQYDPIASAPCASLAGETPRFWHLCSPERALIQEGFEEKQVQFLTYPGSIFVSTAITCMRFKRMHSFVDFK